MANDQIILDLTGTMNKNINLLQERDKLGADSTTDQLNIQKLKQVRDKLTKELNEEKQNAAMLKTENQNDIAKLAN